MPIFPWNVPLVSLIFLMRSLVFSILCFSLFLCIEFWGWVSYLPSLFFGTLPSDGYIFPFHLAFHFSFLFLAICKASSDNHFAFLHFFFLGMVLITASCTISLTSIHRSSGTEWGVRCAQFGLIQSLLGWGRNSIPSQTPLPPDR